jgi:Cu(I)/Ag(I) efflux system membrane fusion protein
MKKKSTLIFLLFIFVLGVGSYFMPEIICGHLAYAADKDIYYCPMHPTYTADKPGSCPICGMNLVKKEKSSQKNVAQPMVLKKEKKLLYYRNPMNPDVTSPTPMKDSMGMDYVPVYEQDLQALDGSIVVNEKSQQMIGVKKEKATVRKLTKIISTVGRVAYDPDLYVAQDEYLQAVKTNKKMQESSNSMIKDEVKSFVDASKKKLLLKGMSEEEIKDLEQSGKAQQYLYLPADEQKVMVYITIYEYESDAVKAGLTVNLDAMAFPGEMFYGKIVSLSPIVDAPTRSITARVLVDNPGNKLKPDMFVNAKINIYLGEKLSVSQEAVISTGERTVVVMENGEGSFVSRPVKLGAQAGEYYEVLSGLEEGDIVVTSGNFLIDSESRLQSAFNGGGE